MYQIIPVSQFTANIQEINLKNKVSITDNFRQMKNFLVYSFFLHSFILWNRLPVDAVENQLPDFSKNRQDKLLLEITKILCIVAPV